MSVFVSPPGLRGRDPFSKLLLTGDALADVSGSKVMGHPYARYALSLNGASQYVQTPSASDLNFKDGDFTIRGWFYLTALQDFVPFDKWDSANNAREWQVFFDNTAKQFNFSWSTSGTVGAGAVSFSWSPDVNAWYFICFSRQSGYLSAKVNGVQIGSAQSCAASFYEGAGLVTIGRQGGGNYYVPGLVCDVEFSKGVARPAEVPALPMAADAHTSALFRVSDSATVVDDSGTGKTWTLYGSPQAVTAHPVTNAGAGVTVAAPTGDGLPVGFAKAFNFSSAYLSLADNADFRLAADAATDFTIDAWCKGSGCICSLFDGTNGWAVILYGNVYGLTFQYGNALATMLASNDTPNTTVWNHCAVVRRNGTLFIYRNGALKASGTLGAATLPATVFRVGAYYWSGSYSYFAGQIANLRVTKGLARWTRDFTPPVRPY